MVCIAKNMVCIAKNVANCSKNPHSLSVMRVLCWHPSPLCRYKHLPTAYKSRMQPNARRNEG